MFCPKLLAGIGQLPDTISDRSIVLPMKRKTTAESVERFRYAHVELQAKPLREALERHSQEELPLGLWLEELNDRAAEVWQPLMALAAAAGGDWPPVHA